MYKISGILKIILINVCLLIFINGCSDDSNNNISSDESKNSNNTSDNVSQILNTTEAQCIINDKRRSIGRDLPALIVSEDSPLDTIKPSECSENTEFRVGVGIHDITSKIADVVAYGNVSPWHILSGLDTRMHARVFAIESMCNNNRFMYIAVDHGGTGLNQRDVIMARIAADPDLKDRWNTNNILVASSHTHSSGSTPLDNYLGDAIFQAVRQADRNLRSNPEIGTLKLAAAELLNTNNNRSRSAYQNNSLLERQQYLDISGNEIRTNREMVQLELHRNNELTGVINWFPVHGTLGSEYTLATSDSKGFASLGFERLMQTNYYASPEDKNFIAAFSQSEVGDITASIFAGFETKRVHPDLMGAETYREASHLVGTKQLAKALELLEDSSTVVGELDYQYSEVKMNDIVISDPSVLAMYSGLPDHLASSDMRTCDPALGLSFTGGGMPDAPAPGREGMNCANVTSGPLDPLVLGNAVIESVNLIDNLIKLPTTRSWPIDALPSETLAAFLCVEHIAKILNPSSNLSCHAEKPVLPLPTEDFPPTAFQLVRIGQLALLATPFEISTMAGRRIKKVLMDVLAPIGVKKIVIVGISNGAGAYAVTREEYAVQEYEGAFTVYGPWTIAAIMQESLKLARQMRDNITSDFTRQYELPDLSRPLGPLETISPQGQPGKVLIHPSDIVAGEDVSATIVAGHPHNDLRLNASFVYIERKSDNNDWISVAEDRDPRLLYHWRPNTQINVSFEPLFSYIAPLKSLVNFVLELPVLGDVLKVITDKLKLQTPKQIDYSDGGNAEAVWSTPKTLEPGEYRFRFAGSSRFEEGTASPYEAITRPFFVGAAENISACP